MSKINPQFQHLKKEYIFSKIQEKTDSLHGLINLGIGDVARPLREPIHQALTAASFEMTQRAIGYGPSVGYPFLKEAIYKKFYTSFDFDSNALFISDGINSDCTNLLELFDQDISVGIPNPTYPSYLDATLIANKARIVPLPCLKENGFTPQIPDGSLDLIFLCSPNNPTGTAMTKEDLTIWIDYAIAHNAIILYDAAYCDFIAQKDIPRSIYEISGAEKVAIEMRSFSKSYGFTGLRCSWAVVPMEPLRSLWDRRQNCKFNGVAYPIQKAALCALDLPLTEVSHYLDQARILRAGLIERGFEIYGGIDSPYIWWKTPDGLSDWEFFDLLTHQCQIISIPGSGFGTDGQGYVRLSAFTDKAEAAVKNIERLGSALSCR